MRLKNFYKLLKNKKMYIIGPNKIKVLVLIKSKLDRSPPHTHTLPAFLKFKLELAIISTNYL
jgi:hypothetical protein